GHDITTREEEGEVDLNETDNGQYPEKEIVRSESKEKIRDDSKGTGETGVIVKFTTSVPKFYGKNKEIFGPYDKEQIVTLPNTIAQILLKKGKVEKVMSS
ncbi:MAG: hypothetical protein ACQESE_05140, partial [Nanobdellota archaeon]